MEVFLVLLSGICWSIVYIELIRKGFKDKTYGMPLFALGLNFAWELIYSVDGLLFNTFSTEQSVVNLIWAALDVVIVFTYFKYGKQYFHEKAKRYFVPFSILAFIACFAMQFAFYFHFEGVAASQYSAFAQNAAMSVLFLTMLFRRGNTRGLTVLMAVAKCLGTLAPTILGGVIESFNIYILLMGATCFVFDLIFIVVLVQWKHQESLSQQGKAT